MLYTPPVLYLFYTAPVVYTSAYIQHRRPFAAHASGGLENIWSMSAWARAIMEAVVEPKRSSLPRVVAPSEILGDMQTGDLCCHISL